MAVPENLQHVLQTSDSLAELRGVGKQNTQLRDFNPFRSKDSNKKKHKAKFILAIEASNISAANDDLNIDNLSGALKNCYDIDELALIFFLYQEKLKTDSKMRLVFLKKIEHWTTGSGSMNRDFNLLLANSLPRALEHESTIQNARQALNTFLKEPIQADHAENIANSIPNLSNLIQTFKPITNHEHNIADFSAELIKSHTAIQKKVSNASAIWAFLTGRTREELAIKNTIDNFKYAPRSFIDIITFSRTPREKSVEPFSISQFIAISKSEKLRQALAKLKSKGEWTPAALITEFNQESTEENILYSEWFDNALSDDYTVRSQAIENIRTRYISSFPTENTTTLQEQFTEIRNELNETIQFADDQQAQFEEEETDRQNIARGEHSDIQPVISDAHTNSNAVASPDDEVASTISSTESARSESDDNNRLPEHIEQTTETVGSLTRENLENPERIASYHSLLQSATSSLNGQLSANFSSETCPTISSCASTESGTLEAGITRNSIHGENITLASKAESDDEEDHVTIASANGSSDVEEDHVTIASADGSSDVEEDHVTIASADGHTTTSESSQLSQSNLKIFKESSVTHSSLFSHRKEARTSLAEQENQINSGLNCGN
jgi:hypothetical protein